MYEKQSEKKIVKNICIVNVNIMYEKQSEKNCKKYFYCAMFTLCMKKV